MINKILRVFKEKKEKEKKKVGGLSEVCTFLYTPNL